MSQVPSVAMFTPVVESDWLIGARVVGNGDATVLLDHLLTVGTHDVVDEVLGHIGHAVLRHDIERTGHLVRAALHVLGRSFGAVDAERLHRVVQRTERYVADGVRVARHGRHHDGRGVRDGGRGSGQINLVSVGILFLDAEQLDERTPRAGAVLARIDRDLAGRAGRSRRSSVGCAARTIAVARRTAEQPEQSQRQNRRAHRHCQTLLHLLPSFDALCERIAFR